MFTSIFFNFHRFRVALSSDLLLFLLAFSQLMCIYFLHLSCALSLNFVLHGVCFSLIISVCLLDFVFASFGFACVRCCFSLIIGIVLDNLVLPVWILFFFDHLMRVW